MPRLIKTKGSTWQVQRFGLGLGALDWRDGISVGALGPVVPDILLMVLMMKMTSTMNMMSKMM